MNLIIYSQKNNRTIDRFHLDVSLLFPEIQVTSHDSIEALVRSISFPGIVRESTIVMLIAADNRDLKELVACREYLQDFRILLILPEPDMEMISKGHLLRARYVDYGRDGLQNLIAVISKLHNRNLRLKTNTEKGDHHEPRNRCHQSGNEGSRSQRGQIPDLLPGR